MPQVRAVRRYIDQNRTRLENTLYSEQQIQVRVVPGTTVDGRIDLITRLDTGETSIVDFKSTERAQAEDITRDRLHIYAVGYEELTGQRADVLGVLNLDDKGKTVQKRSTITCSTASRIRSQPQGKIFVRTDCLACNTGAARAIPAT
jgi:DNA helicase II / ATP-dependent DNA helicase PcrA